MPSRSRGHIVETVELLHDEGWIDLMQDRACLDGLGPVSYTHLTLPTTPYV